MQSFLDDFGLLFLVPNGDDHVRIALVPFEQAIHLGYVSCTCNIDNYTKHFPRVVVIMFIFWISVGSLNFFLAFAILLFKALLLLFIFTFTPEKVKFFFLFLFAVFPVFTFFFTFAAVFTFVFLFFTRKKSRKFSFVLFLFRRTLWILVARIVFFTVRCDSLMNLLTFFLANSKLGQHGISPLEGLLFVSRVAQFANKGSPLPLLFFFFLTVLSVGTGLF
mmetsp:Transcript_13449/g.26094  ORF Transcript_13449/g.26094 Transcript_13449/m.26094 type:complete len:220 (-) Transcript_13449:728-1387(-)